MECSVLKGKYLFKRNIPLYVLLWISQGIKLLNQSILFFAGSGQSRHPVPERALDPDPTGHRVPGAGPLRQDHRRKHHVRGPIQRGTCVVWIVVFEL